MGKYGRFEKPGQTHAERTRIHPIWRGIGCLMMVLIPLIAYAGGAMLVQENLQQHWLPAPPELYQTVSLPIVGGVPHFYGNLVAAAVLSLLGFAVLTMLFAIIGQASGATGEGPYDAPPVRRHPKGQSRKR